MSKIHVLLVDDEEELVSTLAERLSLRGIEADWVTTAEEALERVQQEKMRAGMKFIFLTGHGSEDDFRTGAAEAGASFYLVKPVNIDMLIERMKEALREGGGKG